ncbi:MAG TPA: site-2 protease family protein [Longimicrobiales bacterium]|nr:site-2 protease family protein [Longimicrobiales bacterium]
MNGFRIGSIFGFEIRIDLSWFIILFLIIWSFSVAVFPQALPGLTTTTYLIMGVSGAIIFFVSLLAHELSHSLVAKAKGIEVESITLFVFGGMARTKSEATSPGDEFQIAGVGPLSSLAIAALLWGGARLWTSTGGGAEVAIVLDYLAFLNFVLAVFNMLPGFPLDGGRVFRSIVWKFTGSLDRATKVATTGGRWLGWMLIGLGILQVFQGLTMPGLWMVFIGWFLRNAAESSYQQHRIRDVLAGVRADQTMSPSPQTVPADATLQRMMDEVFMRSRYVAFPVVDGAETIGLVTLHQLREVPREKWADTTVRDMMLPLDPSLVVAPEENMMVVMDRLRSSAARRVVVMQDGRLVGIITARDVTHWLERARQLEEARA